MLPEFLVVGAEKSGTTALYGYLTQHPDIFIPAVKECRYFSRIENRVYSPFDGRKMTDIPQTEDEYRHLFADAQGKVCGDISPDYLYYYEESIRNILELLGSRTKIIIILRDPVSRAHSNYMHLRRENLTSLSFTDYLAAEDKFDSASTWWGFYLKQPGLYAKAVAAYRQAFNSVKVIYFDDFIKDPAKAIKDVFDFIGVDSSVSVSDPAFRNKTGVPRNTTLHWLLSARWPGKRIVRSILLAFMGRASLDSALIRLRENNLQKEPVEPAAFKQLKAYYADDTRHLEALLGALPWQ